jgi:TusA-related sulfurtransferase
MSLSDQTPDRELDAKGLTCPMPTLEAKMVLKSMKPGQIMRMELDYKPAVESTLPRFFQKAECEFEVESPREGLWVFYVKR